MNAVPDVKLKNLLQDYKRERDTLFERERPRLRALIEERYSQYPAEGEAIAAVFDDAEVRGRLLSGTALTTSWVAEKVKTVRKVSRPELVRGAIETWADALGVRIIDDKRPQVKPQQEKQQTSGWSGGQWQFVLSLAAIALALFLTGGDIIRSMYTHSSLGDLRATTAFIQHPVQEFLEKPSTILGFVLWFGGVWGLVNSFKK